MDEALSKYYASCELVLTLAETNQNFKDSHPGMPTREPKCEQKQMLAINRLFEFRILLISKVVGTSVLWKLINLESGHMIYA